MMTRKRRFPTPGKKGLENDTILPVSPSFRAALNRACPENEWGRILREMQNGAEG